MAVFPGGFFFTKLFLLPQNYGTMPDCGQLDFLLNSFPWHSALPPISPYLTFHLGIQHEICSLPGDIRRKLILPV